MRKKEEEAAGLRERRRRALIVTCAIAGITVGLPLIAIIADMQHMYTRKPLWYYMQVLGAATLATFVVYALLRLLLYFQWREQQPTCEDERREAQYDKFMELLSVVKRSLINRGGS